VADTSINDAPLLSPRRLIVQLVGFVIGAALLIWCIKLAIGGGDWSKLRDANVGLLGVLLGCTCVSLFINGSTFWLTVQPVARLSFWDLQRLNLACNLLNYAPIRVGAIARVAYHMRVDRVSFLHIAAWFGSIVYTMAVVLGACLTATMMRPSIDWIWAMIVTVLLIVGGVVTRVIISHRLFAKYGQGIDRILRSHRVLWGAMVLRLLDLTAFLGRMWAAAAILGLEIPTHHILILAVVAFTARLIPFGRVGFAEAAVTALAARLASVGVEGSSIQAVLNESGPWAQLALVESAGEALILIPGGAITLLWLRRRWRRGARSA